MLTAISRTSRGSRPAFAHAASILLCTAARPAATCPMVPMLGGAVPGAADQGQRAPSEIIPRAARMANPSPNPAYREVTSLSTFSLPTEVPMSL